MLDATGQPIRPFDLVMFDAATGGDRGLAVKSLPGERISVLCVDGSEVAKKACELTVVDRTTLCPAVAVTSTSDRAGQAGVVTGVATALDLVRLDVDGGGGAELVATGVSLAEVRPVRELNLGSYVVSGAWLGRVAELSVDVDVLFDDGSVCRVTQAGDKLRFVRNSYWSGKKNCFFPGDRVAGDASVFKVSRWLRGHWKSSRGEGIVAKVGMGGVVVYWAATLLHDAAGDPPAAYQPNPRDLTFVCSGDRHHMWVWGVGDRCFFRRPPPHARKKMGWKGINRWRRRRSWLVPELFERPMTVANTRTTVDVLWQDGTRQQGVPSASLLRTEHDFFPGHRVVANCGDSNNGVARRRRVGVVKSLSYKDQTACVSWITDHQAPAAAGESYTTVMSTYDLRRSSDYDFFYGDVVVRKYPRVDHPSVAEASGSTQQKLPAQISTNKAAVINDLSWVGHIVDLCDTQYIYVKWGDGITSKVLLHEIDFINQPSYEEMLQEMGDWVLDEDNDGAIDKVNNNDDKTDGGEGDHNPENEAQDGQLGATAIMDRVGNTIRAVIQTASGMLAHTKSYMVRSGLMLSATTRVEPAVLPASIQTCSPRCNDNKAQGTIPAAAALESHGSGDNAMFRFKHFDVVQSPQDHHYLDCNDKGSGGGRKWLKRVQKEWKILETSLPDTINVRAFEDRMDLLRAVIVGASGTPYQDGLFFFDMLLPPPYPDTPPQVKYHSFGLRVNPNLYPSGTVCLSLLGTFGGTGPELWSPETSSILQVVVSIQGLVLTSQPYYNEAGYTAQIGTPEGRRNELPYCEKTYLANLHTMLHLIRQPPVGFEAFVKDHFCRHGRQILQACQAYLQEACPVATLNGDACPTDERREQSCSKGFRLALATVVPRLVEAFSGIGAQGCDEFDWIKQTGSTGM